MAKWLMTTIWISLRSFMFISTGVCGVKQPTITKENSQYPEGLVQECSNSSAISLLQSCTKPSICLCLLTDLHLNAACEYFSISLRHRYVNITIYWSCLMYQWCKYEKQCCVFISTCLTLQWPKHWFNNQSYIHLFLNYIFQVLSNSLLHQGLIKGWETLFFVG